jgi:predicted phage terminase large subunit-like protein
MSRDQFQKIVQSWDTGMSALATSDWSVGTIWGYRDHRWYLLDVFRQQLDYPDLRDAVVRQWRIWKPDKVLIEDASNGKSLYQEIWKQKRLFKPLMILPQGSKEERLRGQLGQIEDGRVVLPDAALWLDKYLAELRAAPNGRNDDQVDSTTQALAWVMSRDAWVNTPINPETGRRLYIMRRATLRRRQG